MNVDVVVVGAGPAGLNAALNLLRNDKSVLILEKESLGGQIAKSPRVENLPGIKEISGLEFIDNFFSQVMDLGAEFELENVLAIDKIDGGFEVTTDTSKHHAKAVIIANGVSHRKIGVPKEDDYVGHGLSYCATCDGAFYANEDVIVVGDANTALQYANMLALTSKKVYLVALFDKLFADLSLIKRMKAKDNIEVYYNYNLKELKGEPDFNEAIFENTKTHELRSFNAKGIFIAVGQEPHNEPFKNLINLNEKGFIITNERMMTNVPGIFAIGDTRVKEIRQVTTATSDGSIAAFYCLDYLDSLES